MRLEDRFRRVKILDEGFTDLKSYKEVYKVASNDSASDNFVAIPLGGSASYYVSNLKDTRCVKWEYIEKGPSELWFDKPEPHPPISCCEEIEYIPKKDFYLALRGEPQEILIKFKGVCNE